MHRRLLPGLSVPVPVCGLGGWALGGRAYGPVEREGARATLVRFIELGGTFIDTAEAYGTSEEIIGEVVAELGCRESVVLATKTQHHRGADIRRALDQSLRRLRTEWIDVYQIHAPPEDDVMMDEVLDVFDALRREGKIRLVGASVNPSRPDPRQNPVSYQPPPQNRILAVTERNSMNVAPQRLTNVVS
jgi:aryl-alcohol dehydrogenase-like predicted oxidoreductase